MKSPVRSVRWLLPFLLTGCFKVPLFKKPPANPNALAPSLQTAQSLDILRVELAPADMVIAGYPLYNMRERAEPIRPPTKRKKQQNANADSPPLPSESAPPPSNSGVSVIGQLSSGDPASSRQQTENAIAAIERQLAGINRPLSDAELKTADHIREFLKQARMALASGDVEGAHTLAAKAQVLLTDLSQ